MRKTAHSLTELRSIAEKYTKEVKPGDILCLMGDLGSGKTTFISMLVKYLGFEDRVQSPTFVIARKYYKTKGKIKTVNHIDLYRIATLKEVLDLDLYQYFEDNNAITIIEWPEVAQDLLQNLNCKKIKFNYLDENSRELEFED